MKVIFLDIDGVLNSQADLLEHRLFGHPYNHETELMNRGKLAVLWHLLEATGAKIVISSTWRLSYTLDQIHQIMDVRIGPDSENRIPRDVFIGMTSDYGDHQAGRSREVRAWLDSEQGKGVTHYVILDDMDAGFTKDWFMDNFVKTSPDAGITTKNAYDACVILDGDLLKIPRIYL